MYFSKYSPIRNCYFLICGFFIISFVGKIGQTADTQLVNGTWTDLLRQHLLTKYDKFARPSQHFNTTRVNFTLEAYHISIDESNSALDLLAQSKMQWNDDKLKWSPLNYGNLSFLQVAGHEIWQPDISYHHSISTSMNDYGDVHCLVRHTGIVTCSPPIKVVSICDLDYRLWPYDTQNCTVHFFSWTHHGQQIDLGLFEQNLTAPKNKIVGHGEWDLLEVSRSRKVSYYECCKEPYIMVVYNFIMKRHPGLHRSTAIVPVVFIVFMSLVNFLLPPKSKKKLILSTILATTISLFLLHFMERIPPSTNKVPLLVSFYSGCLYQSTLSLIISIAVINLSQRKHCPPLPRLLKKLLTGWFGKILGISQNFTTINPSNRGEELREPLHESDPFTIGDSTSNNFEDEQDKETMISPSLENTQNDWLLLATAIDRISLFIFCNVFALMFFTSMP